LADDKELQQNLKKFAVLQLSGCSGCEVALLNSGEWIDKYRLAYMPLVVSAHGISHVDVLLVTGGIRTDEDLYHLRRAVRQADQVVAAGTCAISGGIASLGDRDDVRELFLADEERRDVPRLLPRCSPIDTAVDIDIFLPGCPPTPELFLAVLHVSSDFKPGKNVCQECGRRKLDDMRPKRLLGYQHGEVLPDVCLVNQGSLCVGTSTRGGCRALCTRPGFPCVGCRGPSDAFIEEGTQKWLNAICRVFSSMTDVSKDELDEALRSPQLSMFLFQFSDYFGTDRPPRKKEKVL
jgi:F420-non-reducing hydrogenase small subunit